MQSAVTVEQASQHLYEALTHHFGNLDLGANDPVVRAISAYGQQCRQHDEEGIVQASKHLWEVLSHHSERLDLGAEDPVVKALSEYGAACRAAGPRQ
ncbi:MAG: hypothetical protein IT303_17175 [Dehalococcoidia bacterium]|nr:hypothetical protein [Dehalococcoidia bacterium]